MGEAVWTDLDQYLVAQIDAAMGQASAYSDLKLKKVAACILRDLAEWIDWPAPYVVVIGRDLVRKAGPHGNGRRHYEKIMNYTLVGVTTGDQETAWQNAKILEKRLEIAVKDLNFQAVQGTDGEIVNRAAVGRSHISLAPRAASAFDDWLGFCFVAIDFTSEV